MIYRKLSATGDYVYGHNALDFYSDLDAVAQAIKTRLQLYKESFWRDLSDGLPLWQSILQTPGSPENLATIDNILQERIKGTPGVETIVSYNSFFNPNTRQYSFEAVVQTVYSVTVITGTL